MSWGGDGGEHVVHDILGLPSGRATIYASLSIDRPRRIRHHSTPPLQTTKRQIDATLEIDLLLQAKRPRFGSGASEGLGIEEEASP